MALTSLPTIGNLTKTDTGSTTQIVDSTVYGGSEFDRNEVAVQLLAFKVAEDLEESELTIQDYDPETATDYTVENTDDGHQKFVQLIIPNYNSATSYTQYDAVYDPTTELFYRAIVAGPFSNVDPTDADNWITITAAELYEAIDTAEESENISVGIIQTVLTFSSSQCLGDLASANAKENCCDGCHDPKLQQNFDELWLLVFTANIAAERGSYTEGERMMRTAEGYCDCC